VWTSTNVTGTLTIELVRLNNTILTITEDADVDDGSYSWTIPEETETANNYQIYIESNNDPDVNDNSRNFRIRAP
jgi:hypothetical protein